MTTSSNPFHFNDPEDDSGTIIAKIGISLLAFVLLIIVVANCH